MDFQFNPVVNESATDSIFNNHINNGFDHSILKPLPSPPQYQAETLTPSEGFPIPENGDADVMLIGSFADAKALRHFLEQRLATQSTGRNWYLLEYENYGRDVGYQIELNSYRRLDSLNSLDVVYPRFRSENTFIQPRLLAKSAEVFSWLKRGAYLYVGSLQYPIEETLWRIIQKEARLSRKDAVEYLDSLKKIERFAQFVAEI